MLAELTRWRRENPLLNAAIWFHLGLLVFALAALPFDHRQILGLNPWVKPLKFDLSALIFLVTMAALLSGLDGWKKCRALIGAGVGLAMVVENLIISAQSLRGVRSHMNYATPRDALAFSVMGLFIVLNTLLLAWTLALWSRRRHRWPPAVVWGVRLGLLAILAGSLEGFLMVVHGGHTIGAKDGLAGLAFINWSSGHGDLRVAHFFALHALQAMPLLGFGISRLRWPGWAQLTALGTGFALYMGVVWLLFRQAMAGKPLLG